MPRSARSKKSASLVHDAIFALALLAMAGQVYGVTFLAPGSLLQKSLFLLDTIVLLIAAYANRQKMLSAVNVVIIISELLAFLPSLGVVLTLAITMPLALALVAYLAITNNYREEPIGIFGTLGFILLAMGFALNGSNSPLLLGATLGFGGLILAVYSSVHYLIYKVRVQLVFALLNFAFCISPLMLFFAHAGL